LTREIARRFNNLYGQVFPEPDTLLTPTSKILGLDRRKMSKSYGNSIFLTESNEEIDQKVMQMITDPQRARRSDPGDPDICNVFTFHEIYSNEDITEKISIECKKAEIGCVECKKIMAENLKKGLGPIREKRLELQASPKKVEEIIADGNSQAQSVATETMREVREAIKI
jgi:tryptophanyl-tRNA synthetase